MSNMPRIFVALDFSSMLQAERFIEGLDPQLCGLKIGKELFIHAGPDFVRKVIKAGYPVFLDLKLHDIPNTVAGAVKAAAQLQVNYLTLHASGGSKMLAAAVAALSHYRCPPALVAVTVLTSFSQAQLTELGVDSSIDLYAKNLVNIAYHAGIRHFVCSAHEVHSLREVAPETIFFTPGIRMATDSTDDQARVMSPEKAICAGSDYLIIGRSITQANDPLAKLKQINQLIEEKLV